MRALAAALALCLAAPIAAQEPITAGVHTEADGTRTLVHEAIVEATPAQAWAAFATEDGWRGWAAPFAQLDFRIGGEIETSYDPAARAGDPANIRNRILAFVPGRMLAFQAIQAPPGFPAAELLPTTWSVVEFEPVDAGRTHVRLSNMGYSTSEGHQTLLDFFTAGNGEALRMLQRRFTEGPVDWTRMR